jgi:hypothetical protein
MHRFAVRAITFLVVLVSTYRLQARVIEVKGEISFFVHCVAEVPPEVTVTIEISNDKDTEAVEITVPTGVSHDFKSKTNWTKADKPTDWKITKITRIDGSDLCKCGCCEDKKMCKVAHDPTAGQDGKIEKDNLMPPAGKKKIDITISCGCEE